MERELQKEEKEEEVVTIQDHDYSLSSLTQNEFT